MAFKSEGLGHAFNGKAALVTGAGSGIGRATALAFAEAGANVLAADISSEGAAETVAMIAEAGGNAVPFAVDVASSADVAAMVAHTIRHFGRLDYAFNNAGISGGRPGLDDFDEALYDRVMAINAKGPLLGMKYQIPEMLKTGGGAIVNMASVAGLTGVGAFAYTASKHAVIGMTKAAAIRYAARNIRINAVCPGLVDTPMVARAAANNVAAASPDINPVGRAAAPHEIAAAVLWLCSDQAAFVVGHPLVVDGGMLAG
jgi:NAD(P)-dependent dehydrogenase (short-subunit alcohol dehydrogenase family)